MTTRHTEVQWSQRTLTFVAANIEEIRNYYHSSIIGYSASVGLAFIVVQVLFGSPLKQLKNASSSALIASSSAGEFE